MRTIIISILLTFLLSSSFAQELYIGYKQKGIASYYANKYHGKKTASGDTYNMYAMTAAHREIPYNSIIKVTNLSNGKWVTLRVNDRGPFTKKRIVDVSKKAALKLDMVKAGKIEVEIEIIKLGGQDDAKPVAAAPPAKEEKPQKSVAQQPAKEKKAEVEKPAEKKTPKAIAKPKKSKESKENTKKIVAQSTAKPKVVPKTMQFIDAQKADKAFKAVGAYNLAGKKMTPSGFGLQIAAFSTPQKALQVAIEAYQLGLLNTFVQTGWSNGKRVYRILVGDAETEDDALANVPLVKKKGFYNVHVQRHYGK